MKRFTIITLGCKVNQCESAALEHLLELSGFTRDTPKGRHDLVVINTCTVTGKAAMQSRQAVRQAVRNNPDARIVVTGCYAQTAPEEIQRIAGVDYIIGHGDKFRIPEILAQAASQSTGPQSVLIHDNILQARCFDPLPSAASETRTRAFLKIQDGCNTFCSYCIVPYARGRSRSMPVEEVIMHLRKLTESKHREVVLTGIHLGAYGKDFEPPVSLNTLLRLIAQTKTPDRIRLSSIEPTEVDSEIIALMGDIHSPLCPHFHIPLQSGDDDILKRMGRPYNQEQFSQIIREIHGRLPYAAIGVDILVGFPGENDAAFNRTLALIDELPVSYLHVFPFSPRKGTPAAGFKARVPDGIVKARCKQLRQLGIEKKRRFYRDNIGREVDILTERTEAEKASGLSDNYIPVVLAGYKLPENEVLKVRIEEVRRDMTVIGRLLSSVHP
jgi:threonylcarbamoyladenosine tRNA methylthiotransferase MtaB